MAFAGFAAVDLAAIMTAILATILGCAAVVLVKALAACIPNVDVGPVHIHPGTWFSGIANDVERWITNQVSAAWGDLGDLFHLTAKVISDTVGAVVSAVTLHAEQIAHIVTTVVPNAINAVEAEAGKELNAARKAIEGDITTAKTDLTNLIKGDVNSVVKTITAEGYGIAGDIKDAVTSGVTKAEGYADGLKVTIEGDITQARKDAEGYADSAVGTLAKTIGTQLGNLTKTVADNLTTAEQYAVAKANGAISTAEDFTTTIGKTLTTDINAVASDASKALTTAVSGVEGDITAAKTAVEGQVTSLAGTVTTDITTVTGDITTDIGKALGGVYDDILNGAGAYTGDLSGIVGLIAGAITVPLAAVAARVAKLEECSVGVCEGSPNNFSSLLKDALGFVEFAGVGGFLAEVINNPATAEQKYADVIGGAFNGGQKALQDLLSL